MSLRRQTLGPFLRPRGVEMGWVTTSEVKSVSLRYFGTVSGFSVGPETLSEGRLLWYLGLVPPLTDHVEPIVHRLTPTLSIL